MKKIYHLSYEFCGVLIERAFENYDVFMIALDKADEDERIPVSTIDFHTETVPVKEATKPITETLAQ